MDTATVGAPTHEDAAVEVPERGTIELPQGVEIVWEARRTCHIYENHGPISMCGLARLRHLARRIAARSQRRRTEFRLETGVRAEGI
jgi:hypothetical protein